MKNFNLNARQLARSTPPRTYSGPWHQASPTSWSRTTKTWSRCCWVTLQPALASGSIWMAPVRPARLSASRGKVRTSPIRSAGSDPADSARRRSS